ncbi:aminotransferase class III-fold pyridoxal phosphate-dependent enzyme [Candidatus Planktophila dulcis]|uniref:aminotransferase class III-fold pyridoxal phosphate-dependent enzyme n=1 Tax=Candidatus Planktophila dulcis TaxID=1884914 RepID=UPI003CE6803B
MMMDNTNWQLRLDQVIPGGAHTYSKGRDVFPGNAPAVLSRGRGCYVWDVEHHRYLDFGMGLKSVVLGYSNRKVDAAVRKATRLGSNLSRPSLTELLAAEELIQLVPGAEMVKFAKNGSNVTTAAIKIARAATSRKLVAVPKEQPFFSFDDWFIGTTGAPSGVPEEHSQLTRVFSYGDINSLRKLINESENQFAAVLMEPAVDFIKCSRDHRICLDFCLTERLEATRQYLLEVRKLCSDKGIVLIFDEMRTGFRWHIGGAQALFNVTPDLSTFGKAIANGYSVSALLGVRSLMQLGSTNIPGTRRTFLLSSTHGAEISSLAAFRQTWREIEKNDVVKGLWEYGVELGAMLSDSVQQSGFRDYISIAGPPVALTLDFFPSEFWTEQELKTKFFSKLVEHQILMPTITHSASHGRKELEKLKTAINTVLEDLGRNVDSSDYFKGQNHLLSPVFRDTN